MLRRDIWQASCRLEHCLVVLGGKWLAIDKVVMELGFEAAPCSQKMRRHDARRNSSLIIDMQEKPMSP